MEGTAYTYFTTENARSARELITILREARSDVPYELEEMARIGGGGSGGGRGLSCAFAFLFYALSISLLRTWRRKRTRWGKFRGWSLRWRTQPRLRRSLVDERCNPALTVVTRILYTLLASRSPCNCRIGFFLPLVTPFHRRKTRRL